MVFKIYGYWMREERFYKYFYFFRIFLEIGGIYFLGLVMVFIRGRRLRRVIYLILEYLGFI